MDVSLALREGSSDATNNFKVEEGGRVSKMKMEGDGERATPKERQRKSTHTDGSARQIELLSVRTAPASDRGVLRSYLIRFGLLCVICGRRRDRGSLHKEGMPPPLRALPLSVNPQASTTITSKSIYTFSLSFEPADLPLSPHATIINNASQEVYHCRSQEGRRRRRRPRSCLLPW